MIHPFKRIIVCVYFWLRWATVAVLGFLCRGEQGLLSGCDVLRLLTAVASLVRERGL